jgi:hypothetical protein
MGLADNSDERKRATQSGQRRGQEVRVGVVGWLARGILRMMS